MTKMTKISCKILNVYIIPGSKLQPHWKDKMQLIITDIQPNNYIESIEFSHIDCIPEKGGFKWENLIGKTINAMEYDSAGYKWLKHVVPPEDIKPSTLTTLSPNSKVEIEPEILPENYNLSDNPELQKTFNFIKNNTPVIFLTGGAGTGKSTFIKYLKNNLKKETGKNCVVLAPTGIAAVNIGGQTIHSFFGLKGDIYEEKELKKLRKKTLIDQVDLIIIDEISMVSSWMLDTIDCILRNWSNSNKAFGGKQMLLIGDLYQLPPIKQSDDPAKNEYYQRWTDNYFFSSNVFSNVELTAIQLIKIYRQKDEKFVHMLNRIRRCEGGYEKDIDLLNTKYLLENRVNSKNIPNECLKLATTNYKVDQYNETKLYCLKQNGKESKKYLGITKGNFNFEHFLTPKELELCIDAKVMITKNIEVYGKKLSNGDIGKVTTLEDDYVEIEHQGVIYKINRTTWQSLKYEWDEKNKRITQRIEGEFSQIPLKLGWAVTIHKSQGLTLEAVAIEADDAWDPGQIYVALSRARDLDGIFLIKQIPPYKVKTDKKVDDFYKKIFPEMVYSKVRNLRNGRI